MKTVKYSNELTTSDRVVTLRKLSHTQVTYNPLFLVNNFQRHTYTLIVDFFLGKKNNNKKTMPVVLKRID